MLSWINELCDRIVKGGLMPAYDFLVDGRSRYFWLYCASGLLIAAVAWHKTRQAKSFRETLLDHEVWASQSAFNDYIIIVITPIMRLTILSWAAINWEKVRDFVVTTLHAFGVSGTVNDSTAVLLGFLLTVTLFVVDDLLRWTVHYLFHRSMTKIEQVCYLSDLFTLPSLRGKGVGRSLIEAVCTQAKANGASRVYWQTHESNAAGRQLYDKVAKHLGFIVYSRDP